MAGYTAGKPYGSTSGFEHEVSTETRRVTGVTPKLLGRWTKDPARGLPKTGGLRAMAKGSRVIKVQGV